MELILEVVKREKTGSSIHYLLEYFFKKEKKKKKKEKEKIDQLFIQNKHYN